MLTLFTVPKPFQGEVEAIQHNALGSWQQLGDAAEVLLIGDESGTDRVAIEYGFRHIPDVERNSSGTPLVSSAFELAHRQSENPVLCYINADIILLDGMLVSMRGILQRFSKFLVCGQRWDLRLHGRLEFTDRWREKLWNQVEQHGELHPAAGSDYFLFPRQLFQNVPPFALGRSGWDNWMIYAGRKLRIPVVDATGTIQVIHQTHDYAHLEGGVPHYRQPESLENIRLAGGRQTIFTLTDATWRVRDGKLARVSLPGGSVGRALEAGLTTRLGHGRLRQALRVMMHPLEYLRSRRRRDFDRIQRPSDARGS